MARPNAVTVLSQDILCPFDGQTANEAGSILSAGCRIFYNAAVGKGMWYQIPYNCIMFCVIIWAFRRCNHMCVYVARQKREHGGGCIRMQSYVRVCCQRGSRQLLCTKRRCNHMCVYVARSFRFRSSNRKSDAIICACMLPEDDQSC